MAKPKRKYQNRPEFKHGFSLIPKAMQARPGYSNDAGAIWSYLLEQQYLPTNPHPFAWVASRTIASHCHVSRSVAQRAVLWLKAQKLITISQELPTVNFKPVNCYRVNPIEADKSMAQTEGEPAHEVYGPNSNEVYGPIWASKNDQSMAHIGPDVIYTSKENKEDADCRRRSNGAVPENDNDDKLEQISNGFEERVQTREQKAVRGEGTASLPVLSPAEQTASVPQGVGSAVKQMKSSPPNPRDLPFVRIGQNGLIAHIETEFKRLFCLRASDDVLAQAVGYLSEYSADSLRYAYTKGLEDHHKSKNWTELHREVRASYIPFLLKHHLGMESAASMAKIERNPSIKTQMDNDLKERLDREEMDCDGLVRDAVASKDPILLSRVLTQYGMIWFAEALRRHDLGDPGEVISGFIASCRDGMSPEAFQEMVQSLMVEHADTRVYEWTHQMTLGLLGEHIKLLPAPEIDLEDAEFEHECRVNQIKNLQKKRSLNSFDEIDLRVLLRKEEEYAQKAA